MPGYITIKATKTDDYFHVTDAKMMSFEDGDGTSTFLDKASFRIVDGKCQCFRILYKATCTILVTKMYESRTKMNQAGKGCKCILYKSQRRRGTVSLVKKERRTKALVVDLFQNLNVNVSMNYHQTNPFKLALHLFAINMF